ncbi:MAG: hypothetical protein OD811_02805 [Alphaproteobacteria bacterium]
MYKPLRKDYHHFLMGMVNVSLGFSGGSLFPLNWFGGMTRSQTLTEKISNREDGWFYPEDVEDYLHDWEVTMRDFSLAYQQVQREISR